MDEIKDLVNAARLSVESQTPIPSRQIQKSTAISKFWRRMGQIYGHKWESAHGTHDADETWAIGLADLSLEEIGNGLHGCIKRTDPWPPSLPEFRLLCRPVKAKRENAAMYHCPPDRALPHKLDDDARERGRAAVASALKAVK